MHMQPVCLNKSFASQLTPCLKLVLRGIKKTQRQNTPLVYLRAHNHSADVQAQKGTGN